MDKLYLIVFSTELNREALTSYFDIHPEAISFWFYNLPSSVFVRSNYSAQQLQSFIQNRFGTVPNLFVIELQKDANFTGWIPSEHLKYF